MVCTTVTEVCWTLKKVLRHGFSGFTPHTITFTYHKCMYVCLCGVGQTGFSVVYDQVDFQPHFGPTEVAGLEKWLDLRETSLYYSHTLMTNLYQTPLACLGRWLHFRGLK